MVVSLTIIPVLAARFLGGVRCPPPVRSIISWPIATKGSLQIGLRFPQVRRPAVAARRRAALVALDSSGIGLHARDGRRGLRLDYHMPVGTSLAQTDKVMRRVEAVLLKTPDIAGLHPPHRRRAGLLCDRMLHGRHPREPEAVGRASTRWRRFSMRSARSFKRGSTGAGDRVVPLVQDQIDDLAGVDQPIEVKIFGPDPAILRELAEQVGKIVEEVAGRGRRQLERAAWAIPTSSSAPTASRPPAWA